MQPSLAPSPHLNRAGPNNVSEQALHEHLSHYVQEGQPKLQPDQGSPGVQAHNQNIDPAIAGPGMMSRGPGDVIGEDLSSADAKKGGKRELSTSKRAAQNRAAQRAFRQRKEGHIKKLEEQVREHQAMLESHKRLQGENYQLRDYIISLQSRLLESQGSFPQPPGNINLDAPGSHPGEPSPASAQQQAAAAAAAAAATGNAPTANMGAAASQLQANAAQAIAEGQHKDISDRTDPALMAPQRTGP